MEPKKVLIVERSRGTREYLSGLVRTHGFYAYAVKRQEELLTHLNRENRDLLLLGSSIRMEQVSAFEEVLKREKKVLPILFIRNGKEALGQKRVVGKANTSSLPGNFHPDDLKVAIEKLIEKSRSSNGKGLDSTIVGKTPAMAKLKRHILDLAKSDLTVLVSGESGTGKELVASAIHRFSPRADRPFIKVNSAALPTNLFESELFGFEKGAFTGAGKKKPGKFQLANSGTILLDEICEIPLPMQCKLLQVLEDSEFSALGSTTNTRIDARVLAATNANLSEMVSRGQFRLDLYYRVNVVSVHIPPLKDRKEDIDLLCDHFLRKYAERNGKAHRPLTDRIREQFYQYSWPGNVRELENVIQAIATLGNEESFYDKIGNYGLSGVCRHRKGPATTADAVTGSATNLLTRYTLKELSKEAARQAETDTIVDVLSRTDWNRKKAAALLKTSYRTLLSKIKEYEIKQHGASIEDAITRSSQPAGDSFLGNFEGAQKGGKTGRFGRYERVEY
ncbi:MAG: sigma-54-dependent Fis family transcriptional regulator [Deltaproteobacteria bacterium]|nr:sigma-54-dependent Fis family transcriptional regulator [Deltaproteobacteria bacterium]